jgi:hypothetical protein
MPGRDAYLDGLLGDRVVASLDRIGAIGYRVRMPDGRLSDWANLSRIRDAAHSLALAELNKPAEQERKAA